MKVKLKVRKWFGLRSKEYNFDEANLVYRGNSLIVAVQTQEGAEYKTKDHVFNLSKVEQIESVTASALN